MKRGPHPTKERLINVTVELLDGERPDKVHVDEVLLTSGISKGSLYHHFEDFGDLIEAAHVRRFSVSVDESIDMISRLLRSVETKEDLVNGLRQVTRATQSPMNSRNRIERARVLGMAGSNPRFRAVLGIEQERLTISLRELFEIAQGRGWMSSDFDPHAAAVLVQAYTWGTVIDDISPTHMNRENWVVLIDRIIDCVFVR